jgi:hypothetical protein
MWLMQPRQGYIYVWIKCVLDSDRELWAKFDQDSNVKIHLGLLSTRLGSEKENKS